MRRINGILAAAVLIMFIVHGIFGALNMMNIAPLIAKVLSHTMLSLIAVHAVISVGLSVQSVRTAVRTKAPYFMMNRLFWARRISGVLIMTLVFFHMTAFGYTEGGVFRLVPFDLPRFILQMLFLLSVSVHVISNVKPVLGIDACRKRNQVEFNIRPAVGTRAVGDGGGRHKRLSEYDGRERQNRIPL